jgi:outer membrane protein TolC
MWQEKGFLRVILVALLTTLFGGCAAFSPDGGFGSVQTTVRERLDQEVKWVRDERGAGEVREEVRKLLQAPLTPKAAVQVALLNNRGLQASYGELGIAEAQLVQAGRLPNPGFSYARLTRGQEVEIERLIMFNVLALVTMPVRTDLERRNVELVKTRVAGEVLQVAADTRRAWVRAVAAEESARYAAQVRDAAEASAELARRMAAVGNISKLDFAREQVFYAEATAHLARARQAALAQREHLTRLMGLWGEDIRFALPERLPDLPQSLKDPGELEASALRQRLDVRAAMQEAENVAASFGLIRATGFVDVLEVGYARNSETGHPRQTGYEIELHLPIFDWGGGRVARAEHAYMQAVNRAADIAVRARSEVREAYTAYRTAHEVAQHYRDEIVPLRRRISDEVLLRYNAMLISVFELLADARMQVAAVNAYIDALRDFWIADANLDLALTGRSPGALPLPVGALAPAAARPGH